MSKIQIFDAPVSTGKTTAIFKWIRDNPQKKYLYISPMLSEVEERVPAHLSDMGFVFPIAEYNPERGYSSKGYNLLNLLSKEKNIAFSHALFTELSTKHLELVKKAGYTLIIDEEVNMLAPYRGVYTHDDVATLLDKGWVEVDEASYGRLVWKEEGLREDTRYSRFKEMCETGSLYCCKGESHLLVTQLPLTLLTSAKEVILITYLFDHGIMHSFLKMWGMEMEPFAGASVPITEKEWKERIRSLITIGTTPSITPVQRMGGLSTTWYSDTATKDQLKRVGGAIRSAMRKHGQENCIFTMPKQAATRTQIVSKRNKHGEVVEVKGAKNDRVALHRSTKTGEGYWLYSGARATNDYRDKTVAIHAYDRYPNVSVRAYLLGYGGEVDSDKFALSEMIQWLWRTGIRDYKPVTFYFLSKRMESLLQEWLDS